MADMLASLLALLNSDSKELGSHPGLARLFALSSRLRPRERKRLVPRIPVGE